MAAKVRNIKPTQKPPVSVEKSQKFLPKTQPIYTTYAQALAQKPHPTLLYQAPSHTIYILASYSGAFFCFSYAAWNLNTTYFHPPEGLAPWVSNSFGGICFLMAAFGGYLLLSPARVINTIKAVPMRGGANVKAKDLAVKSLTNTASKEITSARSTPELQIEIELRKMFPVPFFPARKILARPEQVSLPTKLYTIAAEGRENVTTRLSKKDKERWENNIMTRPFQLIGRGFVSTFNAMARAWTREGFLKMEVKEAFYKLDVTGGWLLDKGKAIDRLVHTKPQ